jgi:diacylglycerol kinase family enzyme
LPKQFIVFINASAGTAKSKSKDEWRELLKDAFAKHGVETDIRFPSGEEFSVELKEARDRSVDGVIVGGGDGSVRTAAAVLTGSKTALGVLPLGTLNHFAKDIGMPLKIEDAVEAIAGAEIQRIDVGVVNDEVFINNSSIGIYPFMVLDRERIQEEGGKWKWHAATLAAFRTLRKFPLRRLKIRIEGETALHRSPIVFIGNNEYSLEAASLAKRERLDRGELSIYIARVESRRGFMLLVLRAMLGKLKYSRDLQMLKSQSAEIISRTSRMPVALDGEVEILAPPLRYVIRKQALKVFVPRAKA